jgi:site-specific recombinase XerD
LCRPSLSLSNRRILLGSSLPRVEVDERGGWTLRVLGKGDKERAIPLPRTCAQVLVTIT